MATQTVHNISYLINDTYELKDVKERLAIARLPAGSVIVSCGVEVQEESDCASFKLGSEQEGGFLIASGSLATKGYIKSEKNIELQKSMSFFLTLTGSASKGRVVVRILYFTPSKYIVEY